MLNGERDISRWNAALCDVSGTYQMRRLKKICFLNVRFGSAFFSLWVSLCHVRIFHVSISNRRLTREAFFHVWQSSWFDKRDRTARLDPTFLQPVLTRWKRPDSHVFKPSIQGECGKKWCPALFQERAVMNFPSLPFHRVHSTCLS